MIIDPFILRAIAAGIGIAVITGILGSFVVIKRMAYFGDALAHSALLGISLGALFNFNITLGIISVSFLFAVLLFFLDKNKALATDTLLGILSHAALSFGLVAISFIPDIRMDLYNYLFGDILTVNTSDILWIYGGGTLILSVTIWKWSSLVLMSVNEDLARAEGVKTILNNFIFMLLITLVVAISIRIIGILLITSMLIIPAATARNLAGKPETMALIASVFGIVSVLGGIYGSFQFDTPTGPSIVATASIIFATVMLFFRKK